MADPDAYIALIASLPSSERLFRSKQPPLSRLRLERRLSALTPTDRATLSAIEGTLSWSAYDMDATGADAIARTKALLPKLESETLRAIVMERMELRATIAALRLRARGITPTTAWGPSRLTRHILANWSDPTFKLDRHMPWLQKVVTLLEADDPLGLERHILEVTFRQLQRHAGRHSFDFEAVVIYVLKWNIFDRWARADARAATSRFESLAQDALGAFSELQREGA